MCSRKRLSEPTNTSERRLTIQKHWRFYSFHYFSLSPQEDFFVILLFFFLMLHLCSDDIGREKKKKTVSWDEMWFTYHALFLQNLTLKSPHPPLLPNQRDTLFPH